MGKWGKWYNKIFIGNPDKKDFTVRDLPKTRVDQYFDVVKLRFSGMVLGNVLYMLFALPLILFSLYYWFSVASLAQDEAIQQVFTGQENLLLSYLLICVPLYAITGPAKAGLYYCLRNWVWNERATIREHFWKEFRRSFWKALLLNLFSAMLLFAGVRWVATLMMNAEAHGWMRYAAIVIGIAMAAYFMSSIYHFPQLVTYQLTFRQILKNSFIYLVVQFPRTLLAVLIYILTAVICYFLGQILLVVILFMGMSFVYLGQMVFSNFLFDKYVNAPEDRRKGMAPLE